MPGAMPCSDSGPPSPKPSTRSDRASGPSSAAAAPSASRSAWPLTPSSLQHRRERHVELVAAEQRPALREHMPADRHAVADRVGDLLALERLPDAAHEHVRRPRRVQDVAVARRPRPDRRRHVIVPGDGDDGAARRGQRVADAPQRRARRDQLGDEALRHAEPGQRLRPPLGIAQREHPGPRGQRQLRDVRSAERARDPLGHAEPAHRGGGARVVRALPPQLGERAQRRGRQPGLRGEARRGRARSRSARASSVPRTSCHAIAGPTGSPRRSSSTPVSAMPATPTAATTPAGASASALAATSCTVRVIACGSSSAPVGTEAHGVRARASLSSSPSESSTSALQ